MITQGESRWFTLVKSLLVRSMSLSISMKFQSWLVKTSFFLVKSLRWNPKNHHCCLVKPQFSIFLLVKPQFFHSFSWQNHHFSIVFLLCSTIFGFHLHLSLGAPSVTAASPCFRSSKCARRRRMAETYDWWRQWRLRRGARLGRNHGLYMGSNTGG